MRRKHGFLLITVFLFVTSMPSVAEVTDLQLQLKCGNGFQGTARGVPDGQTQEAVVHFLSCPSASGCRTKIWKNTGVILTEVEVEPPLIVVRLVGVDVSELEEADMTGIRRELESPESHLVPEVWEKILEMGLRPDSSSMECLNHNMQGFEFTTRAQESTQGK